MKCLDIPIIVLVWASIFPSLFAQNLPPQDILHRYTDNTFGTFIPKQIINARDGGFIVTGTLGQQGFIAKLDPCGDFQWNREYLMGTESTLNSIAELPSGELVSVGTCLNCAPGDTSQKALVIKTDTNGLILADTTFGHLNFSAIATAVICTETGKAAITGWLVWAGFLKPTRVFLTTLDESLQTEIWEEYNHFFYDKAEALTQTSDGGFVLAGFSSPQLFAPNQAQLFRTNTQGQLLWKNTSTYLNSQFKSVQEGHDGKIIALGQRQMDGNGKDAFLVVHESLNGNLLLDKNYGTQADDFGTSLHKVEAGYLAAGRWGEPSQSGWSWRDWVFRLDENFEIEEDFFLDGYLFGHNLVNVVPLSPDGRNFAFFSRAIFFSSHFNIFFKRTLQGRHLQLTEAPQHYQLFPRDSSTGQGTVTYQGILETPGYYDEVQLNIFRNGTLIQSLTDPIPAEFSFQVDIPAELANYTFRLIGVKNGQHFLEAEACDVVAGDAYLIQGQSNAVAGLPYDPDGTIPDAYDFHSHTFVRNFGLKYNNEALYTWHKEKDDNGNYADNNSGQWGLILGKKIAEEQGIPVAIINGGISGIPIDNMMPDPLNHSNPDSSYGRFLERVNRSGLKDHLRGIVMFQGETNAAGGIWDSAETYYQKFTELDDAWQQDFPSIQQRYLFQIRPGAYFAGATLLTCLQISEAQRRIAEDFPEWQIMSSTGMNHDGTHYYYENGYERAGNDIYRLISHDLYDGLSTLNIYPPTVDSAWFSTDDQKEITLRLHHSADDYFWTPGWEADFRLEGSTDVSIEDGEVAGNTATLVLSAAPGPGFSGLSYTAHPIGSNAPIKNANGIGLLTFYNFPIDPPTVVSLLADPENIAIAETFSVFPNPCQDFLHLHIHKTHSQNSGWEIYDLQGRLVKELEPHGAKEIQIQVSDWSTGIYLVKAKSESQFQSFMIVKE
ncbi:MAG: hypothetical protein DHS20C18_47680 [Saprospiraceae bacterium]|nr:MAG: hypothetical protein DHS20C18_47680 [Saprospiraceae bacterium]